MLIKKYSTVNYKNKIEMISIDIKITYIYSYNSDIEF
jgi:hypothetical protein